MVVAVLFVVIVIGAVTVWATSPRLRARYYAGRIGEGGNNGPLAAKIIALGPDVALPVALDMLNSEDYLVRKHAMIIIGRQDTDKVKPVVDDILAALKKEDYPRNRSVACSVIMELYIDQPQHCDKMVPFLRDRNEEVRRTGCSCLERVLGVDIPGRTVEYWLEQCEKVLKEHGKKLPGDDNGSAGN